jgi:hypothetical protein
MMTKMPKPTIEPQRTGGSDADDINRLRSPVTGRDITEVLASSPLAEVPFDRLSVKSKVRDVDL